MTAPVRDSQVVLAKFFGALLFYIVLWVPTLLYFAIFQKITHQPAANSAGAYWGSYLMLLLLGMFYISIGCLASVLTKNQMVAAIISFCSARSTGSASGITSAGMSRAIRNTRSRIKRSVS